MSSQSTGNEEELDENKIDFDLLNKRHRDQTSDASSDSSTILSDTTNYSKTSEVWPLHLTPRFIDHYIAGDLIGSGSYAEVRECVDTRTLERCALKIVNKEYLVRQAPRALANQMQEIRMLRHFKHGNIISMRECLHKGSFIYIALEFCSFSLNELLNDQPENKLHIVVARRFFHQLCHGLRYLHSLGIVHRDIKPDNLLLTNSGTLKIIDFGVSHILPIWSRDDLCSNYEGTPLFQAPEVVAGQAQYHGFKVDTWSSGVTLFLMLFGTYPFMDEALLGLYDKILGQDLEVPKKCPASRVLSQLLCTMLEKDCSRRASIDEVLEHSWLRLCHANLHDTEVAESSDFFDLVTSQGHVKRSRLKDVYRSMSVLPYLYRHHFPKLPTRKSKSRSGSTSTSGSSSLVSNLSEFRGHKVERINSISPTPMGSDTSTSSTSEAPSQLSHRELSSYNESSTSRRWSSSSPTTSSPPPQSQSQGAAEDQDADRIEWGTEEQYQLMKVPPVRANRVRRAPMRRPLARSADKQKRRSPKASG